ncbi:MAG: hypothetical protein RJB10_1986 [Pseudomonadota bacterium]
MAWHNKFPLAITSLLLASVALVAGCNVGKTDTVATTGSTTTTTTAASNNGTYSGAFTSPVKLLCIDAPGLDPAGHGECGQRYTLEGSVSFTIQGNTVTAGDISFYGYSAVLSAPAAIDAAGNFNFNMEHANGRAQVVNGVLTGVLWEGPFEWKYGEYRFVKQGGSSTTQTTTTTSGDVAAFAGSYAGTVAGGATNGTVDANGTLTMGLFGSGVQYHNWIGTINKTTGAISGTWSHANGDGVSGTFTGSKR